MSPKASADENACCRCRSDFVLGQRYLSIASRVTAGSALAGEPHFDELLRRLHRKCPKADGVDQLEDGGVGADAEGQRENRRQREPGLLGQLADGHPQIAQDVLDHRDAPLVAHLLFPLLDATDRSKSRGASLLIGHPSGDVLFDLPIDVERQLVVELPIERAAADERPPSQAQHRQPSFGAHHASRVAVAFCVPSPSSAVFRLPVAGSSLRLR